MAALSQRRFLAVLAAYLCILLALRVILFTGASEDDAEQLLYSQVLALGYKPNQPPLYGYVQFVNRHLGASIGDNPTVQFVEAAIPRAQGRRVKLAYIPVTKDQGSCH
jgi:hypothetical protein